MTREQAEVRARALVEQMTLEEKIDQLINGTPAIERLGINGYNWWNEASHGVARAGMATVFPHAIALAATFDPDLIGEVGDAVSTEARAKYNINAEEGDFGIYKGLTYWAPNINIFRDPRWGRGQETFGEDPFLTAKMGVEYIGGLQGHGEFLKSAACVKHLAIHSGPESLRHTFDVSVSEHDLWETYLPAFEWTVKSGVAGVMGAYNRAFGEPCCASEKLMGDILYGKWNFGGYFVSDCGAIADICNNHHYTNTMAEAAAVALKRGCHLNCGFAYRSLIDAYEEDLITEDDITDAVVKLFEIRHLLGEFEEVRPYSDVPFDKLECREHRELNLRAAEECMVLLKNDGILPLDPSVERKIAVIGPNAMSIVALEGNYNGKASENITIADGIRRVFSNSDVRSAMGSHIYHQEMYADTPNVISECAGYARNADVIILCLGLDCHVEGEENGMHNEFFESGDRNLLYLPETQMQLAKVVCRECENVIVVVLAGSAVDLGDELTSRAKAIIHGWYPGAVGGLAAANLIAGKYSPNGKLPLTFYRGDNQFPEFTDYAMTNRTYRYFTGKPLYPFGYGLSYTKFEYSDVSITSETDDEYEITFTLANPGRMDGVEKVQIYASYTDSRTPTPIFQLCGLKAVRLAAGEKITTALEVNKYWLKAVLDDGWRVDPDGKLELYIGGQQPDEVSRELTGNECIKLVVK